MDRLWKSSFILDIEWWLWLNRIQGWIVFAAFKNRLVLIQSNNPWPSFEGWGYLKFMHQVMIWQRVSHSPICTWRFMLGEGCIIWWRYLIAFSSVRFYYVISQHFSLSLLHKMIYICIVGRLSIFHPLIPLDYDNFRGENS